MKYTLIALFVLVNITGFAQNKEGAWDNVRATNETLILEAGKRKFIKSADLPAGTTEVVYRISLLDDNQKLSSSLVSILKAIPDPTGISQGSAGAVFLLSSISGDDKCKYYVFTNENDAIQFEKNGVTKNACFAQDEPINKAAKLLSEKSKCIAQGAQNLWFGFQSDNWVMKEKIVLEVVPWVDYKLKSGWSTENKKELLVLAEKLEVTKRMANKDLFLGYFIDGLTAQYTYADYKKLLTAERVKAINGLTEESLIKSGQLNSYLENIREEAKKLNFTDKTDEGLNLIQKEIIEKGRAKDIDYGLLGNLYLSSKQFVKAEEAYLKAISMNKSELSYQLQLAHVYLFTDQLSKAKDIHKKYRLNNLANGKSWVQQTKSDFQQFEKNGFSTDHFKKILRVLD